MNIVLQNACPKAADLDVACTVGADKVWYSIERYVFWLSDDFFTIIGTTNTYKACIHIHTCIDTQNVWFGKEIGLIFYEIFKRSVLKLLFLVIFSFSPILCIAHQCYCCRRSRFVLYRHCMLKIHVFSLSRFL